MSAKKRDPKDKWILVCFLVFFGIIFIVDGIFVYTAVTTQTGLVTERPYEKGIAYNELLKKADSQRKLIDKVSYEEPNLIWKISDEKRKAILSGNVTARIFRPVQEGLDFDVTLEHTGDGEYSTSLSLPKQGSWTAKLTVQWEEKLQQHTYKTTYAFIAK